MFTKGSSHKWAGTQETILERGTLKCVCHTFFVSLIISEQEFIFCDTDLQGVRGKNLVKDLMKATPEEGISAQPKINNPPGPAPVYLHPPPSPMLLG